MLEMNLFDLNNCNLIKEDGRYFSLLAKILNICRIIALENIIYIYLFIHLSVHLFINLFPHLSNKWMYELMNELFN